MVAAAFDALEPEDRARYAEVAARGAAAGLVRHSGVVAWILDPIARPQRREIGWLLALDAAGRFTRVVELDRGEADRVVICRSRSCADVAAHALAAGEPWAILAHNHPTPRWLGGGAWPSNADADLTEAVAEALRARGLGLLDHVILSHAEHYSFTEGRLWPTSSIL